MWDNSRRIAISLIIVVSSCFGVQVATTPDGKQVILNDDGSWRYASKQDIAALRSINVPVDPPRAEGKPKGSAADSLARDPSRISTTSLTRADGQAPDNPYDRAHNAALADVVLNKPGFDFRNARWGMTAQEVRSSEKAKLLSESPARLEFDHTFEGMNCKVSYEFQNGKLVRGQYHIKQDHIDPALFYSDFERLSEKLSELYGPPSMRNYDWKNDMYKADRTKWGFAISIGFLECKILWKVQKTNVDLNLSGSNHRFGTIIQYSSS